jgi:hypothetical protein
MGNPPSVVAAIGRYRPGYRAASHPGTLADTGAKLDDYELLVARAAELTAAGPPVARPEGQTGIVLVP